MGMKVFHKVSAALLAIVGLTAASDSMAYCQTGRDIAWYWYPDYVTLSCGSSGSLATFELNPNSTNYKNARINLLPGKDYAQLLGMTQSGAYVSNCGVDDLTPDNVPAYLNWNGTQSPNCAQAYIAHMVAGG
jgi:hypothetical protein